MKKIFSRSLFGRRCPSRSWKKRSGKKLKAACLAIGLASAWGGEAEAADLTLRLEVEPVVTLTDAVVFYFNGVTSGDWRFLGTLPEGVTSTFTHTLVPKGPFQPQDFLDTESSLKPGYIVTGLYDDGGQPGVSVSFPDTGPIVAMQTWDEAFAPIDPFDGLFSEADIVSILSVGGVPNDFLNDFARTFDASQGQWFRYLSAPVNTQATLVQFSDATFGGTTTLTAVPEPSSFVLICLASLGFLLIHRRDGR